LSAAANARVDELQCDFPREPRVARRRAPGRMAQHVIRERKQQRRSKCATILIAYISARPFNLIDCSLWSVACFLNAYACTLAHTDRFMKVRDAIPTLWVELHNLLLSALKIPLGGGESQRPFCDWRYSFYTYFLFKKVTHFFQ
jgi:hypothetical protein